MIKKLYTNICLFKYLIILLANYDSVYFVYLKIDLINLNTVLEVNKTLCYCIDDDRNSELRNSTEIVVHVAGKDLELKCPITDRSDKVTWLKDGQLFVERLPTGKVLRCGVLNPIIYTDNIY